MTVGQLIEELEKYPTDVTVWINDISDEEYQDKNIIDFSPATSLGITKYLFINVDKA